VSFGVADGDDRWVVKTAVAAGAAASLHRAIALHRAVRHRAIIPLLHVIESAATPALVYPWFPGEVLYPATTPRTVDRSDPASAIARFRREPLHAVIAVLDEILDAHVAIERAGFVAVDFYDGCIMFDFAAKRVGLCDLDEYRPGPFTVEGERLPGSTRYMAPEELRRGATIDAHTTVFNLGRAIRLLLDSGDEERAWRGTPAQLDLVARATSPEPSARHPSVHELAAAWRAVR
jgi:serine/threonine-protein kinase